MLASAAGYGADGAFMTLERDVVWLAVRGGAARPRKPDSGHTDTISITIRVRRASQNPMKPRIQCVLTQ